MASAIPLSRKLLSLARLPLLRVGGYPTLVTIEVTKRCNARCDFCDYWKTGSEMVLDDYAPVVQKLRPQVIVLSGGEPLLRHDLERIVRGIRVVTRTAFLCIVTHAGMLSVKRGLALKGAGLDQINISLDYLDERHDEARGIPGLARKIMTNGPLLAEAGVQTALNTVIKRDNLDQLASIVNWADSHGMRVSFSAYADVKVGNPKSNVTSEQMPELRRIIDELIRMKAAGSPVTSSSWYLRRVPEFFERGGIPDCTSGRRAIHVTPSGHVKRCPEFPVECHYAEWTPETFGPTGCEACWYSCRGEPQSPVTLARIAQVLTI